MINVLHLRDTDKVCGPGKTILETVNQIDKKRFNLSIGLFLLHKETKNLYYDAALERNIPIIPIRTLHQFDLTSIFKTIKIIKDHDIHILHSHEYKSDIIAFFVSKIYRIPIVTTTHGWITHSLKRRIYIGFGKKALPHFDKVIAVSPKIKSELIDIGVSEDNIALIYNAIVSDNYRAGAFQENVLRKRFKLSEKAILIGKIGRLSPEKGQKEFLLAARDICQERKNVYFFLIGDGPDRKRLEKMAIELSIGDRVFFTGHVQDVRPIFQDLDIIALTSYTEGFPNVILEALCMGKPVVASNVGGVPDIIQDDETGCLVPPKDAKAVSRSFRFILENPKTAEQFVKNGQKLVLEKFEFKTRVERIQNLYAEILAK